MVDGSVQVFLHLVKCGLWERDIDIDALRNVSNVDWKGVVQMSQEQTVIGLVAVGIEHGKIDVPLEIKLLLTGRALLIEQQNRAMNRFVGKLTRQLEDEGIRFVLVKGQSVAQCYERPLWRTSGDVDMHIDEDNYEKANIFLTTIASSVDKDRGGHRGMTIGSWKVEMHHSLHCGLSRRIDNVLDEIQSETFHDGNIRTQQIGDIPVPVLSVENDVLYVFNHFLKHFYKGGIGLRQICDWCRLLWTYQDTIDLHIMEYRIQQMGLMTEWKAFGAFAVEYLGMSCEGMPFYSNTTRCKRKAERIKNFVLMSGNFGRNRDMTYYNKYPYLIRKCISMSRRIKDAVSHSLIFPLGSIRFFPNIMFNGMKSATKGY